MSIYEVSAHVFMHVLLVIYSFLQVPTPSLPPYALLSELTTSYNLLTSLECADSLSSVLTVSRVS